MLQDRDPGDETLGDPKPGPRVRNPELYRYLHLRWRECVLCGESATKLSLHHVSKHPRDDLEPNLVMLCGSGTTGCHGLIEAAAATKKRELAFYIREHRLDTISYLDWRFPHEGADSWLRRIYGA